MSEPAESLAVWADAVTAAALFAVDPVGTGGVVLRALPGPARERWLALARERLPSGTLWRRVPLHAGDERLLGGLDLAATLRAGRPVAERGILAECDGGVICLAMAERLAPGTAARLAAVLDQGMVALERDGFARRLPARLGVIALDEGLDAEERPPLALRDRLAFELDLRPVAVRDLELAADADEPVVAARARLARITAPAAILEALAAAALALGIASLRAPLLALRVARAAAALAGQDTITAADAALAARLVLAHRATRLPTAEAPPEPEPPAPDHDPPAEPSAGEREAPPDEVVLAAARAAIPAGLLARLRAAEAQRQARAAGGRGAAERASGARGRPAGVRRGEPRHGARLDLVATLRAAAPWQPLRRAGRAPAGRVEVRRDDFRVKRLRRRAQRTTIFVVDASGSTAFQRLAEAKGAVELLLAECYVRRDQVALLAFRGAGAELLLPPTRSLARAKRSLASLPGGGGTPLAAGLDAAAALADAVRRRGETPVPVVLTDGRANVASDGVAGRARAEADALAAAARWRALGLGGLLVDTARRPQARASELAAAMGARYLALPDADATALSGAVRATAAARPAAPP